MNKQNNWITFKRNLKNEGIDITDKCIIETSSRDRSILIEICSNTPYQKILEQQIKWYEIYMHKRGNLSMLVESIEKYRDLLLRYGTPDNYYDEQVKAIMNTTAWTDFVNASGGVKTSKEYRIVNEEELIYLKIAYS